MTTKTPIRILVLGAVAALSFGLLSTPAYANQNGQSTATWVSEGDGYNNAYSLNGNLDTNAIVQKLKVEDGTTVDAFCVDINKSFHDSATFMASDRIGIANLGPAGWIAKNGKTTGTALTPVDAEAVAEQIAIWHFTNGIAIDASKIGGRQDIADRANALVAAAQDLPATPTSFNINAATANTTDGKVQFTATLTTDAGKGISGETITFTVGSNNARAVTDSAGSASVVLPRPSAQTDTVSATWTGSLQAGTLLTPTDGSQPMIIAGDAAISRTATVGLVTLNEPVTPITTTTTAAPSVAAVTTTTTAAPKTTVTTTAAAVQSTLPYTGISDHITPLVVILGIIAVGVGGFFLRRRYFV